MADPRESHAAVHELNTRIYHQGGCVYPAASAALPFLVTLAADRGTAARVAVVELVGDLARAARRAKPRFVDAAWPAAWARDLVRLVALLDDGDPQVRRQVGFPLAQTVVGADVVLQAVRRRWEVEDDAAVRIGLLATAGQLLRGRADAEHAEARQWLAGKRIGPDHTQRLAAVVALSRASVRSGDAPLAEQALTALRGADLRPWGQAWCGTDHPAAMISWIDGQWGADPNGRTLLAAGLLAHPDAAYRSGALRAAAEITSRWRSPTAVLLPLVAERLTDQEAENRAMSAYLLAACGTRAAAWADQLAEASADAYLPAADLAVLALTRLGDPRCIAPLLDRLTSPRLGYALNSHHGGGWWTRPPGILDVLSGVPQHAARLLPAVRARLRAATTLDERRTFTRVLAAWGHISAPAIEDLLDLLDSDAAVWALHALAETGPPDQLALPTARIRSLISDGQLPASARQMAVRAYWRLTGDAQPALDLFLPLLADRYREAPALDFLAELGTPARRYADRVRTLLHGADHPWLTAAAATALWRITGDPSDSIAPLIDVVRQVTGHGQVWPPTIRAIGTLGQIGPPAADALPVLRLTLAGDRRLVEPGQWDSIARDDEFQRVTAVALRQIAAG
ncbi:hypothetical protein ACN27J_18975 [Solwaraspora sp. WMMB762]|uniref:hypothetical protein n=1 Tax=Solwaraspora sp. WMMB762 TaxID=3404120 RepID=UPI003B946B3F